MNIYSDRIAHLRKLMQAEGIDVYYIPMSDCHNSEYVGDHFRCIEFITGFTGSAGHVVVTMDEAWLFADGRYYIQAANQLEGSGIRLMKWGQPSVPEPDVFLRETAKGKVLGFDGCVVNTNFAKKISETAAAVRYKKDLVGEIWTDRPEQNFTEIWRMSQEYCGEGVESKLKRIRDEINKMEIGCNYAYLIASLDDIAWIYNIRANDVPNNPVAYAYALIEPDANQLFTHGEGYGREWYKKCKAEPELPDTIPEVVREKIREKVLNPVMKTLSDNVDVDRLKELILAQVRKALQDTGVASDKKADAAQAAEANADAQAAVQADALEEAIASEIITETALKAGKKDDSAIRCVLMDMNRVGYSTWRFFTDRRVRVLHIDDPSTKMKGVKNETEIKCLKEALKRDSAVVIKLMHWVKENAGKIHIDELSIDEYLLKRRAEDPLFIEPSFDTIAAYKENAAMMHYEATTQTAKAIEADGMLLVDSGGQYQDGTTDITRTFVLGPVSDEEKKSFTLTAVSMLRLLNAKWLEGCRGENLDIMAREPMWREGLDYKCGTGHGVGHVLNVHEGPHNIRYRIGANGPSAVLEEGMVVTDEPGVYREGKYGIRTENELLVVPFKETEDGKFLQFENLTFIPIDLDGIDAAYLTEEDKKLLNTYHESVYETMAPLLDDELKSWLREYTRPV